MMEELAAAGYTYDSSAYPSTLLPLLRLVIALRGSGENRRSHGSAWSAAFGPRRLHRVETPAGPMHEIPMWTLPGIRLPYYHTMRFMMPGWVFRSIRHLAHSSAAPLWYQFHAVDFLSVLSDDLDDRISCHPGMRMPLDEKLRLAEDAVQGLTQGRSVGALRELTAINSGSETSMDLVPGRVV
jgi:hypothetical protein